MNDAGQKQDTVDILPLQMCYQIARSVTQTKPAGHDC